RIRGGKREEHAQYASQSRDQQAVEEALSDVEVGPRLYEVVELPGARQCPRGAEDLAVVLEGAEKHPDDRVDHHHRPDDQRDPEQRTCQWGGNPALAGRSESGPCLQHQYSTRSRRSMSCSSSTVASESIRIITPIVAP